MQRHPVILREEQRLHDLRRAIVEQDLLENVLDLELYGYTVVLDPEPIELFDQLRETIMRLAEEDREQGNVYSPVPENGYWVWRLLMRDPVFEKIVLSSKPLTLITYLLGESCVLSSCTANIVKQGAGIQGIHTDTSFVPNPLSSYSHVANVCWCLDDFTAENGSTRVVPGSHKLGSQPPFLEGMKMLTPIEAPRGSVIVMHGNLWHCAGPKSTPGERVGLLNYFCRMYMKTQEPYSDLVTKEMIERNPPRFAELVGVGKPYSNRTHYGPEANLITDYFVRTRNPFG